MNIVANENPRTKGQVEAEISEALIKFEKEYMGRGPDETKTYMVDDLIVIRLQRVLTPAEQQLAKSDGDVKGRSLIKQVRRDLESGNAFLVYSLADGSGSLSPRTTKNDCKL